MGNVKSILKSKISKSEKPEMAEIADIEIPLGSGAGDTSWDSRDTWEDGETKVEAEDDIFLIMAIEADGGGTKTEDADTETEEFYDAAESIPTTESESGTSLNTTFEMLVPHEVTKLIFSPLDIESKKEARSVCKLWNELVNPTICFSPWLHDSKATNVIKLAERGVELKELRVAELKEFKYPEKGIGFPKVDNLQFIPTRDHETGELSGISEENLIAILNEYSDFEYLYLHSGAFLEISRPSVFCKKEFKNLTFLEISSSKDDGEGFLVIEDIFQNSFPKLTDISFNLINGENAESKHPVCYMEVFQFVAKHFKTLKSLDLHFVNAIDERTLSPFLFLIDHSIPQAEMDEVMKDLPKVQLTELIFYPTLYEGNMRFLFGMQLLNSQCNLQSLEIGHLTNQSFDVWATIPGLLARCAETLMIIKIQGCFCRGDENFELFSCSPLKNSKQLIVFDAQLCGFRINNVEDLPTTIKTLNLGHMGQIDYITSSFTNLQVWDLSQGITRVDNPISKLNVRTFKQIVRMPKLKVLYINEQTSTFKRIRKIITKTPGIRIEPKIDDQHERPGCVKISIDRKALDLTSFI